MIIIIITILIRQATVLNTFLNKCATTLKINDSFTIMRFCIVNKCENTNRNRNINLNGQPKVCDSPQGDMST